MMAVSNLPAQQFAKLVETGDSESIVLLDVRTPAEFRASHIQFARNLPLNELDSASLKKQFPVEKELYVICQSGKRSQIACEQLLSVGYNRIVSIEGGMQACTQTELPIRHGKKVMSLERQVRIAAGSLVLLGIALSYLHPFLLGLSAFVGAGLIFAGVTDTCGMGLLLARMPWNR